MRQTLAKMSLTQKLIATFLLVGVAPLATAIGIAYYQSSHSLTESSSHDLAVIATYKSKDIHDYFSGLTTSLQDVAANPLTGTAFAEFAAGFRKFSDPGEDVAGHRAAMEKFYAKSFAPTYKEKSSREIPLKKILGALDPATLAAQTDFIADNPHPVGQKDQLVTPTRAGAYATTHAKYHEYFRDFITRNGLYDLFLVDAEGRVVYTVFKEADFATSLKDGPWSTSGLARAFAKSRDLAAAQVHFEDYQAYAPSYEAPASFAATPLFVGKNYVGSLIIQLPLDKITAIAGNRDGLGANGDAILVGSDLKLRADTFRHKDTHTVAASFREGSTVSVTSAALERAAKGENGVMEENSYDGLEVLAHYTPVQAGNMTWYLVTELDQNEVYASLQHLTKILLGLLAVGIVVVLFVAVTFGRSIGRNLTSIALTLEESFGRINATSQTIAGASEQLSSASTEQAASLEETAASLNEISSMVAKSTENARGMADGSSDTEAKAETGKKAVEEMLRAIQDINSSNDTLMQQIDQGNSRLSEIIKVIQDISSKTRVINEIVFQTKLLSFNASVEAARAGEHGKGFAVVAEEVGNLAKMSGSAAKEISDMLEESMARVAAITAETKTAVETLAARGKEKVQSGIHTAERCSVVFHEISANVSRVASLAKEVSTASMEQAQGVSEINKAIAQIDAATQQNAAAGEASATSAKNLSDQAIDLEAVVRRLMSTIDGEGGNPQTSAATPSAPATAPTARSAAKASRPATARVLPFPQVKKESAPVVKQAKVSGSDIPDANHPGFEDV